MRMTRPLPSEQRLKDEYELVLGLGGCQGEELEGEEYAPVDLRAALAQIEDVASASGSPRVDPPVAAGLAGGGGTGGARAPAAEAPLPPEPPPLEPPLLPCESWLARGGVHDMDSPLVRVANDDLQEAALRGDLGLVRRLVHAGASVNAPMRGECHDEFMSLLHILALKPEMPNSTRIMAEIISEGANLNVRSSFGSTPLIFACLTKHLGAVEVLLEACADTTPADDYGRKAAACALLPGREDLPASDGLAIEVLQLLDRAGADLNDGGDDPPLVHAVRQRNGAAVASLLAAGCEAVGLLEAAEWGEASIIRELIAAEASPFLRDKDGRTAAELAQAHGDDEIVGLIRDYEEKLRLMQHPHHRLRSLMATMDAAGRAPPMLRTSNEQPIAGWDQRRISDSSMSTLSQMSPCHAPRRPSGRGTSS